MGTLYVDEDGAQRAFRVSQGRLAVGSGESAKLRLASQDVADLHADLEVVDGELYVEPRSGVLPPKIHGVPVTERVRVVPGQELRIGGARLVWRKEEGEAAVPATPATPAAPGGGGGPAPVARRSRARRRGPARRSGVPGWLVGALVVAGLLVAAFVVLRSFQEDLQSADREGSRFHLGRAETLAAERNADAAEEHLAAIVPDELSADERVRIESVREAVDALRAEDRRRRENALGETWFEYRLEDYEKRHLGGEPSDAVVRLFLERCAEFRERWPEHPRLEWVERQERRFQGVSVGGGPLGLEDVLWRAEVLTYARPRDYAAAFELIDGFRETADADDREAIDALASELRIARREYHEDQLRTAQAEYEKGNHDRAFEWLVQSVVRLGDEEMEDEAARILVAFPEADALLRGYQRDRPEDFRALIENSVVAEFARERGVL